MGDIPSGELSLKQWHAKKPPRPAIKIGPAPMPSAEQKQELRVMRKAVPAQRLSTPKRSMGSGR